MNNPDIRPDDWLPYRARRSVNLYELACLLHRQDPKRFFSVIYFEQRDRDRAEGIPIDERTPDRIAERIDLLPEQTLGDAVGGTLATLRKATGVNPFKHPVSIDEARRVTAALCLEWPSELDTPRAPTQPAPSASAPAASLAEPVRFADLPRVMAEAMHTDSWARAGARINLEAELVEMVASGRLKVRDSLTLGPHPYPVGDALKNAVLLPDEVRQLLAERGVSLPVVAHPMTTERQAVSSSPPVPPYSHALRDLGKALDQEIAALAVPSFEAIPEPVAAPAEAVPVSGAGGDETPVQRRERLQQRVDHWKAQGVRNFTARVAAEEGVTEDRIRKILGKGRTKPATAKPKAKPRPPATFCSGLMTPAGRAR